MVRKFAGAVGLRAAYIAAQGVLKLTAAAGGLDIRDTAAGLGTALTKWTSQDGSTTYVTIDANGITVPENDSGTSPTLRFDRAGTGFFSNSGLRAKWNGGEVMQLFTSSSRFHAGGALVLMAEKNLSSGQTGISCRVHDGNSEQEARIVMGPAGSGPGGGTQRALYIDTGA